MEDSLKNENMASTDYPAELNQQSSSSPKLPLIRSGILDFLDRQSPLLRGQSKPPLISVHGGGTLNAPDLEIDAGSPDKSLITRNPTQSNSTSLDAIILERLTGRKQTKSIPKDPTIRTTPYLFNGIFANAAGVDQESEELLHGKQSVLLTKQQIMSKSINDIQEDPERYWENVEPPQDVASTEGMGIAESQKVVFPQRTVRQARPAMGNQINSHGYWNLSPPLGRLESSFRPDQKQPTTSRNPEIFPQSYTSQYDQNPRPLHRLIPDGVHPTPNQEFAVINLLKTLSLWKVKYSGTREENLEDFLRRITQIYLCLEVRDEELLLALPLCLYDAAWEWYSTRVHLWKSWAETQVAFRHHFAGKSFQQLLKREIEFRQQHDGEPLRAHISAMQCLFLQTNPPMPVADQIMYTIRNMKPRFNAAFLGRSVQSMEQLDEVADEIEALAKLPSIEQRCTRLDSSQTDPRMLPLRQNSQILMEPFGRHPSLYRAGGETHGPLITLSRLPTLQPPRTHKYGM